MYSSEIYFALVISHRMHKIECVGKRIVVVYARLRGSHERITVTYAIVEELATAVKGTF